MCVCAAVASFSFFLWGKLDLHLAQFLMPLGFVTTLLGRLCLLRIARQSSSRTLLLVAIATTIVVALLVARREGLLSEPRRELTPVG